MKAWWPWIAMFLLPGGIVIASLELLRRRHAREHAADYVAQIQVLKSDTPLGLPAIKPLQARVVPRKRRRASRAKNSVSPFGQRMAK